MRLLSALAAHWTGDDTGVTVIIPPPGTVGSGEVRGGAPATREFDLLDPVRLVDRVDAVVLSGGSAFGLAAADGVARLLRSRAEGFPTPLGPVPVVIGLSIFDDSVATNPPDASSGAAAALAALSGTEAASAAPPGTAAAPGAPSGARFATGRVGAGTGAHTGKWRSRTDPGGVGVASGSVGQASVVVVVVVNAWGDVMTPSGAPYFAPEASPPQPEVPFGQPSAKRPTREPGQASGQAEAARPHRGVPLGHSSAAPTRAGPASGQPAAGHPDGPPPFARGNTTIAVVLTDARLSKGDCYLLSQSGHTGFARAIHPAHSRYDGDAVVALATGEAGEADLDMLRAVTAEVTAEAIRSAVGPPRPSGA